MKRNGLQAGSTSDATHGRARVVTDICNDVSFNAMTGIVTGLLGWVCHRTTCRVEESAMTIPRDTCNGLLGLVHLVRDA